VGFLSPRNQTDVNTRAPSFNVSRLRNLTADALKVAPAVNQVELNFWNPQPELVAFTHESGLLLEAYSPLGGGKLVKDTLNVPEIKEAAEVLGMTPVQIVVSWLVQHGVVALPKSVTPSRIEENLKGETVSELSGCCH
jgi:diketogulonate reductase-like aldo/keto reductase